jgi:hypothetical protein
MAAAVLAVVVMSAVALLGSDRYGLRWGPVALVAGPIVYLAIRRFSHLRTAVPSSSVR